MSHSLVLKKGATTLYTFDPCPFVSFGNEYFTDDNEPPTLVVAGRTWTVDGFLLGTSSALKTAWALLLSKIEDPTNYPDAVLFNDGAGAVQSIVADDEFVISAAEAPRSDRQWRSELGYKLKITCKTRMTSKVLVQPFSDETSYDDAGLRTRTIAGEVATKRTVSASDFARTLGLLLPDGGVSWRYRTNGPDGVDVRILNKADTKASFVSTIRESGAPLPPSVSADYSQETEEATTSGVSVKTVTVRAVGLGAEAAARAADPGTASHSIIRYDPWARTASGVFSDVKPETGLLQHNFSVRPGGLGIGYTLMSGGRDPLEHDLPSQPCEITEDFTQQLKGQPRSSDFRAPAALAGFREDPSARVIVPRRLVKLGASGPGSDLWEATLHRVYRGVSASGAFKAIDDILAKDRAGGGTVPFDQLAASGSGGDLFGIAGTHDLLDFIGFGANTPLGPLGFQ